ncbi:hypothetical protein AB1I63_04125 [Streptococcus pneumoniae]
MELKIITTHDMPAIGSQSLAKEFDKEHSDIIGAIEKMIDLMTEEKDNLKSLIPSDIDINNYFIKDTNGYFITQNGFALLVGEVQLDSQKSFEVMMKLITEREIIEQNKKAFGF